MARTLQDALGSNAASPATKLEVTNGQACAPEACPTGDAACLKATPWWNADFAEVKRGIESDRCP